MTFLPVAQRELLAASRRRLTFRVRGVAGILAVLVGFFGLLFTWGTGARSAGAPIFHFLAYVSAFMCALAGLVVTADSIAAERREGTLGFLFLTDLTGFDVLTGKLVAAGVGAATALLAAFPVMAIGMILGGVTGGEFWRHTLALVNLLWVSVTVGLLASVQARDSGRALFNGGLVLLLLAGLLPVAASAARSGNLPGALDWLWALGPVEPFAHADHGYFTTRPDRFWRALVLSHGVGWSFLGLAAWRLPSAWQDRPEEGGRSANLRRHAAERLPDGQNPVTALCRPARRERGLVWGVVGLTVAAAVVMAAQGEFGWTVPVWGSVPFSPGFLILKGAFAWHCCAFFHGLRQGAGELLLTTPLKEMEIIGGGWAAARKLVQRPLVVLVAAFGVSSVLGGVFNATGGVGRTVSGLGHLVLPAYVVACLVVDLVALAWLSARFGLRSGSPALAFGWTMGLLLVPRVLICVPDLLSAAVILAWAQGSIARNLFPGLAPSTGDPAANLRSALRGA